MALRSNIYNKRIDFKKALLLKKHPKKRISPFAAAAVSLLIVSTVAVAGLSVYNRYQIDLLTKEREAIEVFTKNPEILTELDRRLALQAQLVSIEEKNLERDHLANALAVMPKITQENFSNLLQPEDTYKSIHQISYSNYMYTLTFSGASEASASTHVESLRNTEKYPRIAYFGWAETEGYSYTVYAFVEGEVTI